MEAPVASPGHSSEAPAPAADARLRRDVAWNLVPIVLLAAVGLGMNFAIALWWGAGALGVFNLVTIAYFAFAVLGACGLQYSVLRAVAERPDDRAHVSAVVVGALVPTLVLAAIAALAFVSLRGVAARIAGSEAVAEGMLWAAPGLFCFAVNKVLFGVASTDVATYAGVTLALGVAALVAGQLPAIRATRVDPVRALHEA